MKIFVIVAASLVSPALGELVIPTVTIGHPGNFMDPVGGYGVVSYSYNIGTTEVTNEQYAAFLNAKAQSDPHGLYNTNMATVGITRSGDSGSYSYSTSSTYANHPVRFVSFWDSARFSNWLHNGQGTGDTEDGAYTLTSDGISGNSVSRNASARWAITSENEWYKAAYYQPRAEGGDTDSYWLYPTSTNTITTAQANYGGSHSGTLEVGSYAANANGVFDMAGNVWEWNEGIFYSIDDRILPLRGIRGGSYFNYSTSTSALMTMRSDCDLLVYISKDPTAETQFVGFRVSQVPAPASLGILFGAALFAKRRRRVGIE